MKFEELQYERIGDANKTYPASTLVIRKQFVDEAIAELEAEIDYEHGVEHRWFQRCMEARAENVRLKRALWIARAKRAVAEQTVDEWSLYKEKHPCGSWRADPFEYWVQAWIHVEKLCRKKAEEYK